MEKQTRTHGKPYEAPECSVDLVSWETSFLIGTTDDYTFNNAANPFRSKGYYGFDEDENE